ncbi:MAG TPA: hypothetical protein VMG12_33030, partial [Polyangiaceae bacterium]|nr:hypothetical protein [Polyangiaceae bacterium]
PLAKRAAQRSRAQSYQPRAAPPAATNESPAGPPRDDFGTRRAHRLRPTGLAAALSGLVLLFATLHFGRSLQDMRVARREARRRRRREARRASGDAKPEPLTPNDLAKLRYTLSVHLALASIIALVLPTVIAITAPERRLAWSAIAYAGALGVGLGGLALLAWVPVVLRGAARLVAGVRGLGVRRRQPGPAPSDDVRALGVQAAATLFSLALMLWLFVAALRWLYTWRALDPTERLHALTRHIDPLGMSPLVPLVYLAAALYLWGAAGLRRVAAEQRFTTRSPFPPDIDGETLQGLTRRLQRIWHGTQFNAELWTLAALALPALYFWRRLLPTFEGDAYDGLLRAGFIVLYGTVAFAGVKFTLTWRLLSRFLRQLAAQPMIDAYDRVALKVAGSFGLQFSARVPDAREFETSAYNCQLLATLAAQIGGSSAPENELFSAAANDLAAASQRLQANVALDSSRSGDGGHDTTAPPRSSSQPKRARDVLVASAASLGSVSSDLQGMVSRTTEPPFVASRADGSLPSSSDQLQAETHTTFFEASATMFSALRQLWQARVRQPLAEKVSARGDMDDLLPGGRHAKLPTAVWFMRGVSEDVFLWTRMAEDFVALRVVTFIHHILFQLRNLLVFALSGALALVLVVASYPLQPSRFVTVFAWFCMLLVILGGLASILFMERNELLSRLGSSGPGRVNLSVPFVGQLVMYVALPTAVVVASVFPEVSELLFSWLEPLARLLP